MEPTILLLLIGAAYVALAVQIHQLKRTLLMANQEQTDRLLNAVATAKAELTTAVQTAVATETQQVLDALNNFPGDQALSEEQLQAIETAVHGMGEGIVTSIGGVYEPPAPPTPVG